MEDARLAWAEAALKEAQGAIRAGSKRSARALLPSHTCEIKTEVLPEFRDIERVK